MLIEHTHFFETFDESFACVLEAHPADLRSGHGGVSAAVQSLEYHLYVDFAERSAAYYYLSVFLAKHERGGQNETAMPFSIWAEDTTSAFSTKRDRSS